MEPAGIVAKRTKSKWTIGQQFNIIATEIGRMPVANFSAVQLSFQYCMSLIHFNNELHNEGASVSERERKAEESLVK